MNAKIEGLSNKMEKAGPVTKESPISETEKLHKHNKHELKKAKRLAEQKKADAEAKEFQSKVANDFAAVIEKARHQFKD